MRILITGSRTWPDPQAVAAALDEQLGRLYTAPLTVVHGGAKRGVDMDAHLWCFGCWDERVVEEIHPALWAAHGNRAGIVRNEHMVKLGADLCLAFIAPCDKPDCPRSKPHGSHGATHCADLAEQAGIDTARHHTGED